MSKCSVALSFAVVISCATVAFAQAPTPTPVDSNIAVTNYAQNHGVYAVATPSPCTVRGGNGCGGCYPAPIPAGDPTSELPKVDPEWSAIGTMITPGGDPSLPPQSNPVLLKGTVALTKINIGGDFPGSHITDDQNTFVVPDPDFNGFLATGNSGPPSCPGEACNRIEMELEIGKYPLFAWAGEGDHVTALGRWIFDCGHPDPDPMGGCTPGGSPACIVDADCSGGETCTMPVPNFNYRAEMHPPQALAVVRNKSVKKVPATQADVYISSDAGGAGDLCTDTHLASASGVLFSKACFLNHCSVTTSRSCMVDKDCASSEKCMVFDSTLNTAKRIADVNGQNFEFDMPLPPPPPSPATLKITTKSFKPAGGIMPKATFQPTLGPTPNLHVIVPMATPLPSGKLPNVFAQRITARWKEDTTVLTHVQVKFTKLTVNNPLKDRIPAIQRQCLLASGGLSNKACVTDADCVAPAGTCATATTKACHSDKDCPKKDFCVNWSRCVGGVTPGWDIFGQVNGDWVRFKKLETIGGKAPFLAPPYIKPSPTPLILPEKFTFNEYVPSAGTVHISTTGHSLNCIDTLYGGNLKDALAKFGLTAGGACLAAGSTDPGRIDITHTGPTFTTAPAGVTCIPPAMPSGPTTCHVTSGDGDGGTCSLTTNKLCTTDTDCPGACSGSGVPVGPCEAVGDCKQCSIHTSTFCASNFDCPAGTCSNNANKGCHVNADCGVGNCNGAPETCGAAAGASCNNVETCNGTCALDSLTSCHDDPDCGANGPCVKGGAFTLEYTIQVKP